MKLQIRKAERKQSKMRINLSGASGSGKTMSALKLAAGLVGGDYSKIVVIDTEHSSSELYSHLGDYNVLQLEAPFDPRRYIEAIKLCEAEKTIEVIIIDSISHEWEGPGGCLDIHTKCGGKFQDWSKVTPLHDAFKQSIVNCSKHIITTCRSKSDYDISKSEGSNKTKVEKVGTKMIQREGFDYEVTISFKINQDHLAEVDKDRTNLFCDSVPFLINENVGNMIRDWNLSGVATVDLSPIKTRILTKIGELTNNYNDKNFLGEILAKINVSTSKEIVTCNNIESLGNIEKILIGISNEEIKKIVKNALTKEENEIKKEVLVVTSNVVDNNI